MNPPELRVDSFYDYLYIAHCSKYGILECGLHITEHTRYVDVDVDMLSPIKRERVKRESGREGERKKERYREIYSKKIPYFFLFEANNVRYSLLFYLKESEKEYVYCIYILFSF